MKRRAEWKVFVESFKIRAELPERFYVPLELPAVAVRNNNDVFVAFPKRSTSTTLGVNIVWGLLGDHFTQMSWNNNKYISTKVNSILVYLLAMSISLETTEFS